MMVILTDVVAAMLITPGQQEAVFEPERYMVYLLHLRGR